MAEDTASRTLEPRPSGRLSGLGLDATVAVLSALLAAGVALDFRRHAEGISFAEEGFFTPEHVFFYSMFLGVAAAIGVATYRGRRGGATWIDAVPTGYGWGVVGVFVFALGGAGDFLWHGAFGFEQGFEALVSPSHLTLAAGAVLFLASPLRACWYRDGEPTGLAALPAVLSAGLVLTAIALFGGFLNPILQPYPAFDGSSSVETLGVAALVTFPLVLVGVGLALCRRFDLPPGSFVLAFLLPGVASGVAGESLGLLPSILVAGLVADGLVARRPPRPDDVRAIRTFAALVPLSFAASYLLLVALGPGIPWTVHVWVGAIGLSGIAGLLLSYAVAPGRDA